MEKVSENNRAEVVYALELLAKHSQEGEESVSKEDEEETSDGSILRVRMEIVVNLEESEG